MNNVYIFHGSPIMELSWPYGKPFYYLSCKIDILYTILDILYKYKISDTLYEISYINKKSNKTYKISYISYKISYMLY